jgi:hypothetical protein
MPWAKYRGGAEVKYFYEHVGFKCLRFFAARVKYAWGTQTREIQITIPDHEFYAKFQSLSYDDVDKLMKDLKPSDACKLAIKDIDLIAGVRFYDYPESYDGYIDRMNRERQDAKQKLENEHSNWI